VTLTMTTDPAVSNALKSQRIELPSWAFGNSGTRFKVFAQKGVPRNPYEKVADAAQVHRYTGVAPTVALHIPWDKVDHYGDLARFAQDIGVGLGTINSNTFQDDDYMLGSVCHPDPGVRRKAVDHLLECVDIMDATGSRDLKLWFADGTNYPGQDDIRARQDRLAESLAIVYRRLGPDQRMVLDLRSDLFEHAQGLSQAYHDRSRTGMLMFRINTQSAAVGAITVARPPLAQALATLVGMFVIVLRIDPQLALIDPFCH
jgi:L-rhamnose isomerase/sugar isomerase